MRWFYALLLLFVLGMSSQAIEPAPLQFAVSAPKAPSEPLPQTNNVSPQQPVHTSMGPIKAFDNPRIVGLVVSTIKAKVNGIARAQKAYLDTVEQQEGKKARQEAEEKLSRYQLLGMDEQGMDYRTYINTVNANPKQAAQDFLDRVSAAEPSDLSSEDYEALSDMSDIHFMLNTGISFAEWMNTLTGETGEPVVQGERFWTL